MPLKVNGGKKGGAYARPQGRRSLKLRKGIMEVGRGVGLRGGFWVSSPALWFAGHLLV